jgi:hypothetical protein
MPHRVLKRYPGVPVEWKPNSKYCYHSIFFAFL